MATFEGWGLAEQCARNVYQMVLNMRDNANAYKARIAAGQTAATVRAVMLADANQYKARVQLMTDVVSRNLSGVTTALTDVGLTITQLNNARTQLNAAADHTLAATLNNASQVNAEADWILANVPAYERLY